MAFTLNSFDSLISDLIITIQDLLEENDGTERSKIHYCDDDIPTNFLFKLPRMIIDILGNGAWALQCGSYIYIYYNNDEIKMEINNLDDEFYFKFIINKIEDDC